MYTIIEDCSPFYIRFSFPGLNEIIEYVAGQFKKENVTTRRLSGYLHNNFNLDIASQIVSMLPMSKEYEFEVDRVAVFETIPKRGSGIHKDGANRYVSFNIPIEINDDKCITSWYADSTFEGMEVTGLPYVRNVVQCNTYSNYDYIRDYPTIKTMIAKPGEMVIFNTDIYHSWDNKDSDQPRKLLTLRVVDNPTFDSVKRTMFNL